MQRYFVPRDQMDQQRVRISGDDARHIQKVMRMKVSDQIECADNQGEAFLCAIEHFEDDLVYATVLQKLTTNPELPIHVTIVQGIPKAEKFDTIVQKGTECGADRFIPFQANRSIALWKKGKQEKKLTRLRKICKEAAEQSHRLLVPEIYDPMTLDQLITYGDQFTYKMVAFEETAKVGAQSGFPTLIKKMSKDDPLLAVIGPEGGITTEEAAQLQEHGFVLCGLGPRILRTETAALYLLSAVSYHFELLHGEVDE
ncbi:16S rRNA (uracil(1498)-N(3))-methyltransferase [Sporolactobacillus kofuensis]|uniref:Ribosomal RNA small subunit methyltransferase E n=1 Tax=Sporolactobacillus kofuensis TaxID=269672 RepID=A0ABW1WCW7_9BACL|nr:16S rRNA (uracil(1498)-N(3))-methyltransferase [Sporolactobacillus kofuensis]MCO7175675.1 16S rRNA (uracil(1498)-N(3))-methyltransferase [Sporolactobacillus kofuensis]